MWWRFADEEVTMDLRKFSSLTLSIILRLPFCTLFEDWPRQSSHCVCEVYFIFSCLLVSGPASITVSLRSMSKCSKCGRSSYLLLNFKNHYKNYVKNPESLNRIHQPYYVHKCWLGQLLLSHTEISSRSQPARGSSKLALGAEWRYRCHGSTRITTLWWEAESDRSVLWLYLEMQLLQVRAGEHVQHCIHVGVGNLVGCNYFFGNDRLWLVYTEDCLLCLLRRQPSVESLRFRQVPAGKIIVTICSSKEHFSCTRKLISANWNSYKLPGSLLHVTTAKIRQGGNRA